jgi:hypothetical protein
MVRQEGNKVDSSELTLQHILLRQFWTKDGESPSFVEVPQRQAKAPVETVVPNVKLAEMVVVAMNKHMAGYLKHLLMDRGVDHDLVTRLVVTLCDWTLVVDLNKVTWDGKNQEIITAGEKGSI